MLRFNKSKFRRFLDLVFIMCGSVVIISISLVIALNFSKDAKLFAKNVPLPSNTKPKITQLPSDPTEEEENDDYGTLTYERKGFRLGEGDGRGVEVPKKLKEARIEIINCSGNEKLGEKLKNALKNIGISSVVSESNYKKVDSDVQTDGNQENNKTDDSDNGQNTGVTSTPDSQIPTFTPVPETKGPAPKTTPGKVTGTTPKTTPKVTLGTTHKTISRGASRTALQQTAKETLVPVGTAVLPTVASSPESADGTDKKTDSNRKTGKNIIGKTLIIERNDKKLGSELKKIIKIGSVIKEIDPGSGFDITIEIGQDYMP